VSAALIDQRTAPPGQQPPLAIRATLPALDVDGLPSAVEERLYSGVGVLLAQEVVGCLVPDHVVPEESAPGLVRPHVDLVGVDFRDDIGHGLEDGTVPGRQGAELRFGHLALSYVRG
jgi:hypothetical protein